MRRLAVLLACFSVACTSVPPEQQQTPIAVPSGSTPTSILAGSQPGDWSVIPADELLILDLGPGRRVVIQLAPAFAPVHVANIQKLARAGHWQGAAIYRVQDNYVAQWGNNETDKPLPAGVVAAPPAEYHRSLAGLSIVPLGSPDPYAPGAGFALGWSVAFDPKEGTANLAHCYGSVGVGRGLTDTGMGGELYAAIGHGPRHLDRNIAVVGRAVSGIEHLSSLPRGTEALGFYKERSMDVPIVAARLASMLPAGERPQFEYLREDSATFSQWLHLRKNRKDDFYIRPAGGVDLCNAPVPVRAVGG